MTWQDRITLDACRPTPTSEPLTETRMSPGLTGTYDRDLREKVSIRNSPIPPDCMGVEGEYDPVGLARRVAKALDEHGDLQAVETLTLVQQGSAIAFAGTVADHSTLDEIVEIASRVDGTCAVDVNNVSVQQPSR